MIAAILLHNLRICTCNRYEQREKRRDTTHGRITSSEPSADTLPPNQSVGAASRPALSIDHLPENLQIHPSPPPLDQLDGLRILYLFGEDLWKLGTFISHCPSKKEAEGTFGWTVKYDHGIRITHYLFRSHLVTNWPVVRVDGQPVPLPLSSWCILAPREPPPYQASGTFTNSLNVKLHVGEVVLVAGRDTGSNLHTFLGFERDGNQQVHLGPIGGTSTEPTLRVEGHACTPWWLQTPPIGTGIGVCDRLERELKVGDYVNDDMDMDVSRVVLGKVRIRAGEGWNVLLVPVDGQLPNAQTHGRGGEHLIFTRSITEPEWRRAGLEKKVLSQVWIDTCFCRQEPHALRALCQNRKFCRPRIRIACFAGLASESHVLQALGRNRMFCRT